MKYVLNLMERRSTRSLALVAAAVALLWTNSPAFGQGVTTGALNGIVTNEQKQPIPGASVIAIHLPSGTNYETVSRADGRFTIPGMRVGGPYSVTADCPPCASAREASRPTIPKRWSPCRWVKKTRVSWLRRTCGARRV